MEKIDKDDIINHMREEEKKLLLLDICARLPYDVNIIDGQYKEEGRLTGVEDLNDYSFYVYIYQDKEGFSTTLNIDEFKMYLRPMSSMTEDEKQEMHRLLSPTGTATYQNTGIATPLSHFGDFIPYEYMARVLNWLNAHHFDYDGLIEKGLALEAPEGMY